MYTLRRAVVAALVVVTGCGGGGSRGSSEPPTYSLERNFSATVAVQPANPDSPYAAALAPCVYRREIRADKTCTLARLPLLGQEVRRPTVDDIMDRVLVSDAWMAQRLRQVLQALPAETLDLFGAVTAVVIARDLRPAFYTCLTGAVYIDPADLWLTAAERDTVDTRPDYRQDFGASLGFRWRWRYTDQGEYVFTDSVPRPPAELVYGMAGMLYHELAHANDAFQPAGWSQLSPQAAILDACEASTVSKSLVSQYPLHSTTMRDLAAVRFRGASVTPALQILTPQQVGAEFAADAASDFYSFSSPSEDLAMLFEETMMLYYFGMDRDVAVTNVPATASPTASDYIVAWGQRNRIGDPSVKQRARLVARDIFPSVDLSDFLDEVAAPRALVAGESWLDNLRIDEPSGMRHLGTSVSAPPADRDQLPRYQ